MKCDYLLPTFDILLTPNNEMCECILGKGHKGEHVTKIPNGKYIAWEFDDDCTDCHPEECECFVHRTLEDQE